MFAVTIKQVALLLFYIAIGYLLTFKKIIDKNASKVLAKLLMWVFSPLYMAVNLSQNVTVEKLKLYGVLFASGFAFSVAAVLFATFFSAMLCKKSYVRNIYTYVLAFSNNGYFGCPLIAAVFGAEMLAHFMIFCLPANLVIYTYGYYILTNDPAEKLSENAVCAAESEKTEDCGTRNEIKPAKKGNKLSFLYSPPMIGTYVGLILGLLPFDTPQAFYDFLTPAADCMSASAMLLVGCVLAGVPFSKLLKSAKPYALSAIRLLLLPIIFGAAGYFLYKVCGTDKEVFIFFTVLSALPAGMNAVVFPESVGKDGTQGAIACFISYVLCLVTIPAVVAVMNALL